MISQLNDPVLVYSWLTRLHKLFTATDGKSKELMAYRTSAAPFTALLGRLGCQDSVKLTLEASMKEHSRAVMISQPKYSQVTRELIIEFVHEVSEQIFDSNEQLVQRTIIVFDLIVGSLAPDEENETLLTILIPTLYLCHKFDNSQSQVSFELFFVRCLKLQTFAALETYLVSTPEVSLSRTFEMDHFLFIEQQSLSVLRYKVDQVSSAQAIFELVCVFTALNDHTDNHQAPLDKLLKEALFLSYICLIDFKPADYPTASIAIACLSMVSYLAPDEQKDAFAEFLTSMQASVSINSAEMQLLKAHLSNRVGSLGLKTCKSENLLGKDLALEAASDTQISSTSKCGTEKKMMFQTMYHDTSGYYESPGDSLNIRFGHVTDFSLCEALRCLEDLEDQEGDTESNLKIKKMRSDVVDPQSLKCNEDTLITKLTANFDHGSKVIDNSNQSVTRTRKVNSEKCSPNVHGSKKHLIAKRPRLSKKQSMQALLRDSRPALKRIDQDICQAATTLNCFKLMKESAQGSSESDDALMCNDSPLHCQETFAH